MSVLILQKEITMHNICDYNAKGDGRTNCTAAVQSAVDACFAVGGGRVEVPSGEVVFGDSGRHSLKIEYVENLVLKDVKMTERNV